MFREKMNQVRENTKKNPKFSRWRPYYHMYHRSFCAMKTISLNLEKLYTVGLQEIYQNDHNTA